MANSYEAELERELAHELHEGEGEFEWESHEGGAEGEGILGAIGNALGGLLGEGEEESHEYELHELHEAHELHEFEGEGEEEFEWESHESSGEGEGEGGILGTIGNVLEWYDFGVYGYLATTMSQLFFPGEDKTVSLLKAFAVFRVGFVELVDHPDERADVLLGLLKELLAGLGRHGTSGGSTATLGHWISPYVPK